MAERVKYVDLNSNSLYGNYYGTINDLIKTLTEIRDQAPCGEQVFVSVEVEDNWGSPHIDWSFYYTRPESDEERSAREKREEKSRLNAIKSLERQLKGLKANGA